MSGCFSLRQKLTRILKFITMRNKRVKNYWRKIRERYTNIDKAKERVGVLRAYDNSEVSFVRLKKEKDEHIIEYSVANWFK